MTTTIATSAMDTVSVITFSSENIDNLSEALSTLEEAEGNAVKEKAALDVALKLLNGMQANVESKVRAIEVQARVEEVQQFVESLKERFEGMFENDELDAVIKVMVAKRFPDENKKAAVAPKADKSLPATLLPTILSILSTEPPLGTPEVAIRARGLSSGQIIDALKAKAEFKNVDEDKFAAAIRAFAIAGKIKSHGATRGMVYFAA